MDIIYQDPDIVVCVKPPRVLSTDEPGGVPDLLRQELNCPQGDFRTVHRLDRVVSGLMVLARNASAASELSRQIRENEFQKEYLAVVHGVPSEREGQLRDLLYRDKARRMTMIASEPAKGVQEAVLNYNIISSQTDKSLVKVALLTGRTHQIRVQFSSRGFPLIGEKKYSLLDDPCEIALWSYRISFTHPRLCEKMTFSTLPAAIYPWTEFLSKFSSAY